MNFRRAHIQSYLVLPVALVSALAGCSSFDPTMGGLLKIQTANDPGRASASATVTPLSLPGSIVAVPTAAPGVSNDAWPAARGCRITPEFTTKVDVDTLYARAMKSFNFKSPEQIAIIKKTVDRLYIVDDGYKHERQAGAYYHLAQSVNYSLPNGVMDAMWLDLEFSKNGANGDVEAKYCTTSRDPQVGTVAFHQSIQKMIRDTLVR